MTDNRYLHLIRQDCPLPPGTHIVAYCRDSGGEEQDRSVGQQVEAVHEYCAHHSLILERVYREDGQTASNTEKRDQLNQLLADIRGRFKLIRDRYKREKQIKEKPFGFICWKSNRLCRDHIESTHIKADIRMRGITIISLMSTGSTGDAGVDALIESFQEYQDEKLLDEISDNSRRGLADLVGLRDTDPEFRQLNPAWSTNDGRYLSIMPGPLPTGFKAERVQIGTYKRKRRGGIANEARIVQRMVPDHDNNLWERCNLAWKMRAEGATYKAIHEATRLYKNVNGYSHFFENRIYTGVLEYGGNTYHNFVEPMVSQEWFDEEQRRKAERAEKLKKQQSNPMHEPRRVASRHLLSGLVFCGAVEGQEHPMNADTVPEREGKRTRWDFYICSHKKNSRGTTCDAPRVGAAALDEAVIESLMTHVLNKENLRPIADSMAQSLMERNADVADRITAVQGQLDEVRKNVNQLLDALEKMGFSSSIQSRLQVREAEERKLLAQLANLEDLMVKPKHIPQITEKELEGWIEHIRAQLSGDDVELARRAIRHFVAKIVVHEKEGTLYYTFPLSDLSRLQILTPTGLEPVSSP